MGDFDLVKVVLDRIGDMRWMQIAIRPAKPFAFGLVDGSPVFGLPGNPVSSMVSASSSSPGPACCAGWASATPTRPAPVLAVADEALARRPDGKVHFVRVVAERSTTAAAPRAHPPAARAPTTSPPWRRADALLPFLPTATGVAPGEQVRILLLSVV